VPLQYAGAFASFHTTTARACERRAGVAAEARLRMFGCRRAACEAEDGEHDVRVLRGLLRAGELVESRACRLRLALPRNLDAHRPRTECLLPADDAEGVRRPLERVVVDADEEMRLLLRLRPQREPGPEAEHRKQQAGDQSPRDTRPRSDCLSTRQPVAKTVRR
jgi:hypothetical protein